MGAQNSCIVCGEDINPNFDEDTLDEGVNMCETCINDHEFYELIAGRRCLLCSGVITSPDAAIEVGQLCICSKCAQGRSV